MIIDHNERIKAKTIPHNFFIAGLLVIIIILICLLVFAPTIFRANSISQNPMIPSLAPMLNKITDAVVNISTTSIIKEKYYQQYELFYDPYFNRLLKQPVPQQSPPREKHQNLGSGVIIDADKGYVLTNYHVIEKSSTIIITLKDGRQFNARLIGSDTKTDIALLKITPEKLTAINLSNSDTLQVGDFVVAIGNPFGLGQTVTSGIISALGRNNIGIEGYEDFIQTDASINPGNSGGALVNLEGELIGINTAILSKTGGNVGIGFAIPINMVKSIFNQLINYGHVSRGVLGVQIRDLTPKLASTLGLDNISKGAIIAQVIANSAAEKAGILAGDIIIQANNRPVNNAAGLRNSIGLLRPGDKVKLKLIRQGKTLTLKVKIGR